MRRSLALGAVLLAAAGCGGTKTVTTTVSITTVPNGGATSVSNAVAAGGHDFQQFACAQCHGDRGQGGVSSTVPPLTRPGAWACRS